MKVSKSMISKLVLFAMICVIFVGLLPTLTFQYLQKKDSNIAVEEFNLHADVVDSLFQGEFAKSIPSSIDGFDFQRLREIGKTANIDYEDTIDKINEPYGSPWIFVAYGGSIVTLVTRLAESIFSSNIQNRYYMIFLSFLGLLILSILYKTFFSRRFWKQKLEEIAANQNESIPSSNWHKVLNITLLILLAAILLYGFIHTIPVNISIISNPPVYNYGTFEIGSIYYFNIALLGFSIIIVLLILITFFLKENCNLRNLYSLIWIVPVLSIAYNLWITSDSTDVLRLMIKTQNFNSNRQFVIRDCNEIIVKARQWYLLNNEENETALNEFDFSKIGVGDENENGRFSFSIEDNNIVVNGECKSLMDEDYCPKVVVTYYAEGDSMRSRIGSEPIGW